jgi:hypothetical protein
MSDIRLFRIVSNELLCLVRGIRELLAIPCLFFMRGRTRGVERHAFNFIFDLDRLARAT